MNVDVNEAAKRLSLQMHRQNSEAALQNAIELLLTDHDTQEVVDHLRAWANYLDERK